MSAATHCPRCGHGLLPRWLEPSGKCPGCEANVPLTDEQRQRAALLEVREQVASIMADMLLMALAVSCICAEVEDALTPAAVLFDGLGADPR
jgi:uncharacterized protein (DUF983 family)